jgi:hypothetical protein
VAILDGTESHDPDENYPLSYAWQIISKPDGSMAILSDPDTPNPFFTPDVDGDYAVQLVVTDSLAAPSEPSVVIVSTINSAPVADAGPDQFIASAGTLVQLDGNQSYDPDGDAINYSWAIATKPDGSIAALSDPTLVNPTFVADFLGTYVIELFVTDTWGLESIPDEVWVTSENVRPVADAGGNQVVLVGDTVYLDGSGSYDANLDPLTYRWSLVSMPKNSLAQITDPTMEEATFEPDVQGIYIVSLVVNDGSLDSDPSNVIILAIDAANLDDFIETMIHVVLFINGLDGSDFNNENNMNALTNKIVAVIVNYLEGNYQQVLDKLSDDIAGKMDGCALGDAPDANDWIMNCPAQELVYPHIELAISILEDLLNP